MALERYRTTWKPPPTLDDYMYEVQLNIWWGEKDRAKRQLLWLMDIFLGDDDEKTAFSKIQGSTEEEGEDRLDYDYCVGRRGAD